MGDRGRSQPNIGGLSFDETLLALAVSAVIALGARYLDGRLSPATNR